MNEWFRRFAHRTSVVVGSVPAFVFAIALVIVWATTGPLFGFSNTWQLVINTGTTIVTFIMVFLIQNTQNRASTETHLKLDELLRSIKAARTSLVNLEELSDAELDTLKEEFDKLAKRSAELEKRASARGNGHKAERTKEAKP